MNTSVRSGFVNHLVFCTLAGLGCSGFAGVGAVWMQHQISIAANENKALELRIAAVRRQSLQLNAEIAFESDPAALLQRNSQMKLGMVAPAEETYYFVTEDPVRHLEAEQSRETAAPSGAFLPGLQLAPLGR